MLYHIDDSTESLTANDITNATTASAVAAAASAATNAASSAAMGSLPIALALDQEQNNKSMESTVCLVKWLCVLQLFYFRISPFLF